jgi:MFS family permease
MPTPSNQTISVLEHAPNSDEEESPNPLQNVQFRKLWVASTVSNIGGWMQDTAGIWLMTAITTSPLPVALMQTAANLPVVLLGLLAGATADIFDRRRLLLLWQGWMLIVVAGLSILSFANVISPWILLSLTCLLNVGGAMNGAAWQSIVPELVSRRELPNAVSLNSAGFNLARSVGPALGGLCVALFHQAHTGAAYTFLINAISFVGVIIALYQWKRSPLFKSSLPAERILGSMNAGLHYARHSPPLKALLARAFLFTVSVSAVWALLAVVAARDLHRGALGYGIFNASMGVGAVVGAATLPSIRRMLAPDPIVLGASGVFVATLLLLALVRSPWILIPVLTFAGFAWTATMSTLNLAVQLSSPSWVQARAIGIYQMVFSAGLAAGSVIWGALAQHVSTPASLIGAAVCLLVTTAFSRGLRMPSAVEFHAAPAGPDERLHMDLLTAGFDFSAGPIRLHIDYNVLEADRERFVQTIYELKEVRLRNGAIRWGVFQDVADSTRLSETFIMESWLAYLRQQERFTTSDATLINRLAELDCRRSIPPAAVTIFVKQRSVEPSNLLAQTAGNG